MWDRVCRPVPGTSLVKHPGLHASEEDLWLELTRDNLGRSAALCQIYDSIFRQFAARIPRRAHLCFVDSLQRMSP